MPEILVVDDEPDIVTMLHYSLTKEGYRVTSARNGEEALLITKEQEINLILLDLDLPKINGLEVCRQLRQSQKTSSIPIIMVTAWSQQEDEIKGLKMGADDYVTKPFEIEVLFERIKALLRRANPLSIQTVLSYQNVSMDTEAHRVTVDGKFVNLGPTEYSILEIFLRTTPGKVVTRDYLLERIWENNYVDDRTIDVHIARLRKKLSHQNEVSLIRTIRGTGYTLDVS